MTMDQKALQKEKERLQEVMQLLVKQIDLLEQTTGIRGHEVRELKTHFWDDMSVNLTNDTETMETFSSIQQEARLLSEREKSYRLAAERLQMLVRLEQSPYFGRIDFVEEGEAEAEAEAEQIYIGLASLMNEDGSRFYIYDWRAPISSMFYDDSPGPASYQPPEGARIAGEMTLKRQYVIREGELQHVFDTDLTIGDSLLQQALSDSSSEQMKSIVATIQREQNQMIRNDQVDVFIVQGGAGSGKTSAALQRVAYLLYKHRNRMTADQIVLFSPNPLFSQYVSHVLPELGEANMRQMIFQELTEEALGRFYTVEDLYDQTERLYTSRNADWKQAQKTAIQWKASAAYFEWLDQYIRSCAEQAGMIFRPVTFRGRVLITAEQMTEAYYGFPSDTPIDRKNVLMKKWLHKQLDQAEKEQRKKKWVQDAMEWVDDEVYQRVYQRVQKKGGFQAESFDDDQQVRKELKKWIVNSKFRKLRAFVDRDRFLDDEAMFLQFLRQRPPFWEDENEIDLLRWNEMTEESCRLIGEGRLLAEDASPYLYMMEGLRGFSRVDGSIHYVLIDEAQDYTPFQYAYIRHRFPRAKLTILGDIHQGIYAHNESADSFHTVPKWLHAQRDERLSFKMSYRSTAPILDFAQSLLPEEQRSIPFDRSGPMPVLIEAHDEDEAFDALQALVREQVNSNRIGIICKTMENSRELYQKLQQAAIQIGVEPEDIQLVVKDTQRLSGRMVVLPAYLSKGIEFESVVLWQVDGGHYDETDRRLFYMAATRAMHQLQMIYAKSAGLPSWWNEIDSDLYTRAEGRSTEDRSSSFEGRNDENQSSSRTAFDKRGDRVE
ncbi:RNA polymerase recycling motor HelD [Marinicrinis sediminis]|uniref:RNA polymerase recycling motor HelD n=1 Tax=Marinicrinis sediminis TaxID=1652465 RepID=A0ABW5R8N5_9BACL